MTGVSPAVATAELAVHWDAAGEAAEALPARVRAGQAADRAHAFPEARNHYERALELWKRVPDPGQPAGLDRVDLLDHAAQAAISTGAAGRAIELAEDAVGRVDPADEPVRAAVLLARVGDHRRAAGDETGALAAYQEAERLLAGTPPSTERARVLASHARTLALMWRSEEAIPRCEEAIGIARDVGARIEEAHALSTLGMCMDDLGELDRAAALQREARRIAEEVGDAEGILRTYVNLNHVLGMAGRGRDALEDAREGYLRACQLGLERGVGSAVAGNLAVTLLDTGRWDECAQFTAEALVPDSAFAFGLHAWRGLLLTRRGDFAAAREQLKRARRLSPPASREPAWYGLAELAIWEGRDNEAQGVLAEWQHWCAEVDPEGVLPQLSLPGTAWPCAWRPTVLSRQLPDAHLGTSLRYGAGPRRSLPSWTGSPPPRRRRSAHRTPPASCCSPKLNYRGWRDDQTRSAGGRQSPLGNSSSITTTLPTRASGWPRPCWPVARPEGRSSRPSVPPMTRRSRSAQRR